MTKYKIRNLKVFKTNIWSFYENILQKMERKNSSKWFFIFKQLEKCQHEYYPYSPNLTSFYRHDLFSL